MRLWMGASRAFGSVVMIVQERMGVSSGRQSSHNPAKAKGVNAVVQLNATGEGGGQYAVALADEKANFTEGAAENPNVTIEVKADDWVKIMSGEMDPTMAFMMGKLKITGDLGLMMRFQQIFGK